MNSVPTPSLGSPTGWCASRINLMGVFFTRREVRPLRGKLLRVLASLGKGAPRELEGQEECWVPDKAMALGGPTYQDTRGCQEHRTALVLS